MTKELAELNEMLNDSDIECNVRENYSGRGIYGSSTTAIVFECSLCDVLTLVIKVAELLIDDEWSMFYDINDLSTDKIGRSGTILY